MCYVKAVVGSGIVTTTQYSCEINVMYWGKKYTMFILSYPVNRSIK